MRNRIFGTAISLVLLASSASLGAGVKKIAVLDFKPYGQATVEQGMDVADNVRLMFYGANKYQVETYRRMMTAVGAAAKSGLDLTATQDIGRLGKALGDDVVVVGSVTNENGKFVVHVAITDVAKREVKASYDGEGSDLRATTQALVAGMSGAKNFGVLFPDEVRDLPAEKEQETRAAIALIATSEEMALFDILSDRGRSMMLDKFWVRRDPDPNTKENEYEVAFWERVAYAQQHFTTPLRAGIETDRGKVYVIYGPPAEIEDHAAGTGSIQGWSEGSTWSSKPYYAWKYYGGKDAGGRQMVFVFVDEDLDGEFISFASTEPGYGKRIGTFSEFDANRLAADAEDWGNTDDTTFWDPTAGEKDR